MNSRPLKLLVIGASERAQLSLLDGAGPIEERRIPHFSSLPALLDRPDAILVLLAPADAGWASLAALGRARLGIPVIAVGEEFREDDAVRALSAGADEYAAPGHLPGGSIAATISRAAARRRNGDASSTSPTVMGEISEQIARLSASNEELRAFSQMVAHDLNSPLKQLTLFAELLERQAGVGKVEKLPLYAQRIREAAHRAGTLLNSLYQAAKTGWAAEPLETVDLERILSNVTADLDERLAESGARLSAEALPKVRARESQMYQLLSNLVDNALKHASDAPPVIRVSGARLEKEWVISVKDNGIGIPEEHRESVFEPFQRIEPGRRKGLGIGLSICRKIVQAHGGRIWVNSAPGRGATFYFSLPTPAGET